jgi:nucleotide-binding universal stress UspA family protein
VIRSIVVGTDGSDTADVAVKQAGDLARSTGATLHIVSAYSTAVPPRLGGADAPEQGAWAGTPDATVRAMLDRAAGSLHAKGVECECHARKGDPSEALLKVAEEQEADVIIVGNKGMHGSRRFLLGSVPDKISHHAGCSVLIVRTT